MERVADLLDKTPRRVSVEFAEAVDLAELRALPGVSDVEVEPTGASPSRRSGTSTPVLKAIARHTRRRPRVRPTDAGGGLPHLLRAGGRLTPLVGAQLRERRRSLLAWGLPLGLWSAFIVAIYPSIEDALSKAVKNYPPALKEAFGIGELTYGRAVPARGDAEPDRAARGRLPGGALGRQRALGRGGKRPARRAALGAGVAPPPGRRPASAPPRSSWRRCSSRRPRPHLSRQRARRARALRSARRWPATPTSGRWPCSSPDSASSSPASRCAPASSPGSVAGVLVGMYVIDLVGRLDTEPRLDPLRLGLPLLRQRDRGRDRPARLPRRHRRGRRPRRARIGPLRAPRPALRNPARLRQP